MAPSAHLATFLVNQMPMNLRVLRCFDTLKNGRLVRLAGIEKRLVTLMDARFSGFKFSKYRQKYRHFPLCQRFDPRRSENRHGKSMEGGCRPDLKMYPAAPRAGMERDVLRQCSDTGYWRRSGIGLPNCIVWPSPRPSVTRFAGDTPRGHFGRRRRNIRACNHRK